MFCNIFNNNNIIIKIVMKTYRSIAANNMEDQQTAVDSHRLRNYQNAGGIVTYANPLIRGFPWSVPDTIANNLEYNKSYAYINIPHLHTHSLSQTSTSYYPSRNN